jgi:hypothetical protein
MVVVVTANHFWLDGIVVLLLLALVVRLVRARVPDDVGATADRAVLRLNRGDR